MKKFGLINWFIYSASFYFIFPLNNIIYSQTINKTFERITRKDGLSHSTVSCILQDKKGFMWFATYGGLNKFDGYTFKVYRNIAIDSTSLSQNEIRSIYEDSEGNIWIIPLRVGILNKYNPETERFTRYKHIPGDSTSISSDKIYDVLQDKSGKIWIATENALNLVINKEINGKILTVFKRFYNTSNINSFIKIYENRFGKLLLFAEDLYYFDKENNKIIKTSTPISDEEIGIHSVCEDKHGNLWLGTNNYGIIKLDYNKKTKNYERAELNQVNVTPLNRTYLLIDHKDRIWIGTEGKGLFQYNEKENQLINFANNEVDINSISDNTIYALYIDHSGILWIGTFSQGLCKYDLYKKQFQHFKSIPGDKNTLGGNVISSIHSTKPGQLWVGADIEGVAEGCLASLYLIY